MGNLNNYHFLDYVSIVLYLKNGAFNKRKHFLYGSSNIYVVLILKIGDSNLF